MATISLLDDGGNVVSEASIMPHALPATVQFPEYLGDRVKVTHASVDGCVVPLDSPVEIFAVEVDGRTVPMFPRLSLR